MEFVVGKDQIEKSPYYHGDIENAISALKKIEIPKKYDPERSGKHVQNMLLQELCSFNKEWRVEYALSDKVQDKADLYLETTVKGKTATILIEIDATRADQVAKKFVSRVALVKSEVFVYVPFTYPDSTENYSETSKYMKYLDDISTLLRVEAKRDIYICGFLPGEADHSVSAREYNDYVAKLGRRILNWTKTLQNPDRREQWNVLIVRSFLRKAINYKVELDVLRAECIDNEMAEKQFRDHFAQMRGFYRQGHGYIFDMDLGRVELSDVARKWILKYERELLANG